MAKGKELRRIVDEYVFNYSAEKNFTQKTIEGKRETLNRVLAFVGENELTLASAREYLSDLHRRRWKPSSIKCEIKVLKAFSNYCFQRNYSTEHWAKEIAVPKIHRVQLELVSPQVAEQIIFKGTEFGEGDNSINKSIKLETRAALRFALRTGLRITELRTLRSSDIRFGDMTYVVHSKGGDEDILPLPRDFVDELKTRQDRSPLFKITEATANLVLHRGAERLGIRTKITNHSLRHIFATNLLQQGAPIQYVSKLLRHKSIEITHRIYAHYVIEDLAQTLNNNHSLIREGLTTEQVFEGLERAVKSTGIEKDKRFVISFEKNTQEISFRVIFSAND